MIPTMMKKAVIAFSVAFTVSAQAREIVLPFYPESEFKDPATFTRTLSELQQAGITRITFEPQPWPGTIARVTALEERTPAGDFFILLGLQRGGEKADDGLIRDADYADTREAVKYASTFRFRVILNLYATIADLKEALSNSRPTIILWTSHGNTSGIYDADSILIPYSIFEKASPSVYQFITASCNGGTALTKYTVPKHIKTWGWSELVYHPGMLANFLNDSSQWGPFINYPYGFKGMLQCKEEASRYYPYNGPTKLPGSGFAEHTSCIQSIMSSVDGFACVAIPDGFGVVSIPRNQLFASATFDALAQCHRRTLTTHLGRTCLRMQSDQLFHIVDSATQTPGKNSYKDRNACISDLFELTPESLQAHTPA